MLLGLLGGGGSILAVPALVYALGLGVELAIPISLIVIGVASAAGAVPKVLAGQVQWRLAGIFAAVGIPATLAGAAIGRHLSKPAIMPGFAVAMVIAGWRMLSDSAGTGTACKVGDDGINWRRCAPRSILSGVAVGLLTGLFGVGGGFLIIPALVLMLGVEMPIAVGTSLLIIVANSAAGLISHLPGVSIDWSDHLSPVTSAPSSTPAACSTGSAISCSPSPRTSSSTRCSCTGRWPDRLIGHIDSQGDTGHTHHHVSSPAFVSHTPGSLGCRLRSRRARDPGQRRRVWASYARTSTGGDVLWEDDVTLPRHRDDPGLGNYSTEPKKPR